MWRLRSLGDWYSSGEGCRPSLGGLATAPSRHTLSSFRTSCNTPRSILRLALELPFASSSTKAADEVPKAVAGTAMLVTLTIGGNESVFRGPHKDLCSRSRLFPGDVHVHPVGGVSTELQSHVQQLGIARPR